MAPDVILVAPRDLRRFLTRLLCQQGMSTIDAEKVSDVLIWADLRGHTGHGAMRLPRYLELIRHGELDPTAQPEITGQTQATFVLNAKRAAGAVAMVAAVEQCCRQARAAGACIGLVRETTHVGAMGYYAVQAVERDCAALLLAAGPPFMAYHGAAVPSLSTSPIAMAVPSGALGPIVLDMATSVVSMGQIHQARARGESIPVGWAITETGKPATDPAQGVIPLPLGGAKGSGLSLMFELFTSVLSSTPILAKVLGSEERGHIQNALVMVLDIHAFRSATGFRDDVDTLGKLLKDLPVREGFDEILLPGERGRRLESDRSRNGIPLARATWDALVGIAQTESVEIPKTVPPQK